MPKLIGRSTNVVEIGGLRIDEMAGNVATKDDRLSIAHVTVSEPTSEPWLTLDYDEWLCVLKGKIELHYGNCNQVLTVVEGETCLVEKGERFRPIFPVGGTIYIPVCVPAFKPERCKREDDEGSDVSKRLNKLHDKHDEILEDGFPAIIYHMCETTLWERALQANTAYFPPTFEKDGGFTHATAVATNLIGTANHFYQNSQDDWICIELDRAALINLGIVTRFEEAKPVGDTGTSAEWKTQLFPHIFGGIPAYLPGIVTKVFSMKRNKETGEFLYIEGLET